MAELSCPEFGRITAELALGVLPGPERARAIAHADHCPDCRDLLRRYTDVGDGLLHLVPPAEPPVGFEQRVVHRLGLSGRPKRLRHRFALAAAAVVIALAAGAGGMAIGNQIHNRGTREQPVGASASGLRQAPLLAGPRQVGTVYLYTGRPSWLYMDVDVPAGTDQVVCLMRTNDGDEVTVGSFAVSGNEGYWGVPSPIAPAALAGARLADTHGRSLATANFTG